MKNIYTYRYLHKINIRYFGKKKYGIFWMRTHPKLANIYYIVWLYENYFCSPKWTFFFIVYLIDYKGSFMYEKKIEFLSVLLNENYREVKGTTKMQ